MTAEWKRAGTVEILRERVYKLDANAGDHVLAATVWVEPGVYPLYRKVDAYCWLMTGRINEREEKIGDGLFKMHNGDNPTGLEVQFPSKVFGAEQLAELMAEPCCQPGPEQRLRFTITEADR